MQEAGKPQSADAWVPVHPEPTGPKKPKKKSKKRTIALWIIGVFLGLAVIGAFVDDPDDLSDGPAFGGGGPSVVTTMPAASLVPVPGDLPTGWRTSGDTTNASAEAEGFRDGAKRGFLRDGERRGIVGLSVEIYTFNTTTEAHTFYSIEKADVEETFSTSKRSGTFRGSGGDRSTYWEESSDYVSLIAQKGNVFVKAEVWRSGSSWLSMYPERGTSAVFDKI